MANSDIDFNSATFDLALPDSVITESEGFISPAPSLEDLASRVKTLKQASTDVVLRSAMAATELKLRIARGEAGAGVKWKAWIRERVKISESHLYVLVRIGSAPNPLQALNDERRDARERNSKRTLAANLSDEHRRLIRLIEKLTDAEAARELRALEHRYPNRLS